MSSHISSIRPAGFHVARSIDVLVAILALILLAPVLIVRAALGRTRSDRWFDAAPALGLDGRVIVLRDFASPLPGRALARLYNLLRGDLALGGPRPAHLGDRHALQVTAPARFAIRPGVIPCDSPRRLMGIADVAPSDADLAYIGGHGALSGVKLIGRWLVARGLAGPGHRPVRPYLDILGLSLANVTMAAAVEWLTDRAASRQATLVAFANPHCFNIAERNAAYRRVLARADRVFADGIGIRIGARMLGQRMADNVNGTDLFPKLCAAAARRGLRLFLLGARPGLADRAAKAMLDRHPDLQVVGTRDGYFDPARSHEVVEQINASGADIVLVALGAPHQELWLARHARALAPPVRMAVGGLFDYYSGRIPRAPAWMREAGLEWLWRLRCEPSRLAQRYLVGNPLFLARVLRQRLVGRRAPAAHAIHADRGAERLLARWRSALRMRMPRVRDAMLAAGKRTLDVIASGGAILVLAPVLALTALAIRLESPGSIVFRQKRVGRHGAPFTMFKFRSMFVDAEARKAALLASNEMAGGVIFKMKNDPRVTRVGSFIRRTSIDELPQLFNVLRGDMSLVGPRPPLPSEVAEYSLNDRGRLGAAPGITCIWQVSGRSEIPFPQQVEMDLDYIQRQSLTEDVRLLLKTVPALVKGRGAY